MVRILIVEDQKIMQKYFEYIIMQEPEFRHVQTVSDAREAVKICNYSAIDLVIMDVQTFQGEIFILRTNHIINVADILVSLVLPANDDLFRILHVFLGDRGDLFRHGSGEEQHISVFRYSRQDLVDTVGETHVQHLVRLIEDDVLYVA